MEHKTAHETELETQQHHQQQQLEHQQQQLEHQQQQLEHQQQQHQQEDTGAEDAEEDEPVSEEEQAEEAGMMEGLAQYVEQRGYGGGDVMRLAYTSGVAGASVGAYGVVLAERFVRRCNGDAAAAAAATAGVNNRAVIAVALCLANKCLSDRPFNALTFARLAALPAALFAHLERRFCAALRFRLAVPHTRVLALLDALRPRTPIAHPAHPIPAALCTRPFPAPPALCPRAD